MSARTNKSFAIKYCIILFCCFIFFSIPLDELYGQKKKTQKKVDNWTLSLSIKPYYDSNILKYSDKYIERFKNGEDPGRFHINRIDDLTVGYSAGLTFSDNFFGNMKTILGAGYDTDAYTYNSIKTWGAFNVFYRQQIAASTSAQVSVQPGTDLLGPVIAAPDQVRGGSTRNPWIPPDRSPPRVLGDGRS